MKTLATSKLNEYLGQDFKGSTTIYGVDYTEFKEVECEDLEDFLCNAELGQCWTDDNGRIYYKIINNQDDAEGIYLNKNGKIRSC